eukprot:m.416861 g.416861  ORF g.416861 m.416861 type:complete len:437 (+) comp21284_c0_seq1:56-1366(+)
MIARLSFCVLLGLISAIKAASWGGADSVELTPASFKKNVLDSDGVWLVAFYAPWCGHCKNLAPQWEKAATATKGIVNFGAVDAQEHSSLGQQYKVEGFPTIKIFGADKSKPTEFQGSRDVQGLVNGALQGAQNVISSRLGGGSGGGGGGGGGSSDVIELTDQNFQEQVLDSSDLWLVAFTAPWCGHCKQLEPNFRQAASELKGKVKLGNVDATQHAQIAGKYNVEGYPTMKIFAAGDKSSGAVDYQGGRDSSDIVTFMMDEALKNMPPPEVLQLNSTDLFETECTSKQLCFLAFLPLLQDSGKDGRNAFLDVLKAAAEKHKRRPFGWVWSEGTAQSALEAGLDVGGFGYPALVALNAKKLKFATMRGQFSDRGLGEFVNKLVAGRQPTSGITEMPAITDTQPWNGEDFVPAEIEEEFDLSDLDDVDLDEEPAKTEL